MTYEGAQSCAWRTGETTPRRWGEGLWWGGHMVVQKRCCAGLRAAMQGLACRCKSGGHFLAGTMCKASV